MSTLPLLAPAAAVCLAAARLLCTAGSPCGPLTRSVPGSQPSCRLTAMSSRTPLRAPTPWRSIGRRPSRLVRSTRASVMPFFGCAAFATCPFARPRLTPRRSVNTFVAPDAAPLAPTAFPPPPGTLPARPLGASFAAWLPPPSLLADCRGLGVSVEGLLGGRRPRLGSADAPCTRHPPLGAQKLRCQVPGGVLNRAVARPLADHCPPSQRGFVSGRDTLAHVVLADAAARAATLRAIGAPWSDAPVLPPQRVGSYRRRGQSPSELLAPGSAPFSSPALLFLDFLSAFPAANRDYVLRSLRGAGLPTGAMRLASALYAPTSTLIAAGNGPPVRMKVSAGVPQGCPFSGSAFAVAAQPVVQQLGCDAGPAA